MNTMTAHFDSIEIGSGRFVNVGHHVTNFGREAVVEGAISRPWGMELVCRLLDAEGVMIGPAHGRFVADPAKCA